MVRSLAEVQGDDSVVGFYQSTTLGAFFNQTLVELQVLHQEKLRRGGLAVVHGEYQLSCLSRPVRAYDNSLVETQMSRRLREETPTSELSG